MPGDTRHSEEIKVTVHYSQIQLSEDITPEHIRGLPIVGPEEYAKVKKWHVNRVFYFLICSFILCLTAVAFDPTTPVQAAAAAVCAGSIGLAKFLLQDAYQRSSARNKKR